MAVPETTPPLSAATVAAAPTGSGSWPQLSFWTIWNMCLGFLGLQFGFALQNANVSRIFQSLGASLEQIPILWIAAPLTGLLVQPLVGYASDRTWTRLGRRRPYFLAGAILAAIALVFMPHAPVLWVAAALLWLLDASINVSMEPFRAFVGDQLPPSQRPTGYAMQSFFIGIGAVVASMLPWLLANAGVSNHVEPGSGTTIPDTVRYSFYIGAVALFGAIGWTVLRSREYPPDVLRRFAAAEPHAAEPALVRIAGASRRAGLLWFAIGAAAVASIWAFSLDQQLYILASGVALWGLALLFHSARDRTGMLATIMHELQHLPLTMRRLIPVQFFSWLALFSMWIYTTAAVTQVHFGTADPLSDVYNDGANWVGVLFAAYNGFAAPAALLIPLLVARVGIRQGHLINLLIGGAGLASFYVLRDPMWLLLSMAGVGVAWASILSLPYAMLADSVPAEKMGLHMGIFNFFIVIPQLVAASVLGLLLKVLFGGQPIFALVLGGASFMLAGALTLRVPRPARER
ncbi:MAG: SLC45 family MFS transporter [Gammaproteobacteria bacterium]|nr:SLC45 family MFS transporter [Gammaproteobacteria bacterium]